MKLLSFDIESSIRETIHGPTFRDPENDAYTIIYANHPDRVCVEHNPQGFNRKLPSGVIEELKTTDYLVGHNLPFDLSYFWKEQALKDYIIRGGKLWDTQGVEYILTGQQHTTASLAELQDKYEGYVEKPSRIGLLYKKGIGADKILAKQDKCPRLFKLYEKDYCRTDGSTPLKIFKAQYARAKAQNMLAIVELYNDYLLAIINMTCTGIHIDINATEKTMQQFTLTHLDYLKKAQEILQQYWNDPRLPPFNINSPDHKSAVLFGGKIKIKETKLVGEFKNGNPRYKKVDDVVEVTGFKIPTWVTYPMKKEGLFCTDDGVMHKIGSLTKNPLLKSYCEYQKLSMTYKKAAKTYCQAFLDRSIDGVLYPNFNNTITPTGRLSSSEPNVQNLPSKTDLAEPIQKLLIAPKGFKCVAIDFSQLEKWLQAWMSQDKALIKRLLNGDCLHCVTLAQIEGKEYEWVYQKAKIENDPVWDEKRTKIKPVGFLMDYGGQPARVAEETELPLDVVEAIFEADKKLYPQKHYFFGEYLQQQINNSATFSRACDIPTSKKEKGKDSAKIKNNVQMLPIFDTQGQVYYTETDIRKVGYWSTQWGKKYHFLDTGRETKRGVRRNFSFTQPKNYPNQGGGADVQAATSAAILKVLLQKPDKIRMVNEVHDSKQFYIREDVLHQAIKWLVSVIEDVPKLFKERFNVEMPFKIPVEVKIGDNFGNLVKYEGRENDQHNYSSAD